MFHFTYSPLPVTMLNGPKCNLTFQSFTHLAKKKVGKRAMFRETRKTSGTPQNGEKARRWPMTPPASLHLKCTARHLRMKPKWSHPRQWVERGLWNPPEKWLLHMLLTSLCRKQNVQLHSQDPPPGFGSHRPPSSRKGSQSKSRGRGGRQRRGANTCSARCPASTQPQLLGWGPH